MRVLYILCRDRENREDLGYCSYDYFLHFGGPSYLRVVVGATARVQLFKRAMRITSIRTFLLCFRSYYV